VCDRLTVLVGAGGSVDLGVPSTKEATDFVVGDDPWDEDDYHKTEGWIVSQVFGVLKQWYRDPADQNFEVLLHAFEGMATLERSWRPGAGGRGRVIWSLLTGGPRGELLPIFQNGFADRGARRLLRRLHEAFAGHPTDKAAAKWRSYETWWRELSNTFDLDIATTNYDRLIEEAMPSVDQGFRSVSGEDVQRFTPMDFRGPGHRLAHLHGSVNFGYRPLSGDHDRFASRDGFHDLYRFDDPNTRFIATAGAIGREKERLLRDVFRQIPAGRRVLLGFGGGPEGDRLATTVQGLAPSTNMIRHIPPRLRSWRSYVQDIERNWIRSQGLEVRAPGRDR
jgi:SIR2-like domain